jgi:hypothetical protein
VSGLCRRLGFKIVDDSNHGYAPGCFFHCHAFETELFSAFETDTAQLGTHTNIGGIEATGADVAVHCSFSHAASCNLCNGFLQLSKYVAHNSAQGSQT